MRQTEAQVRERNIRVRILACKDEPMLVGVEGQVIQFDEIPWECQGKYLVDVEFTSGFQASFLMSDIEMVKKT